MISNLVELDSYSEYKDILRRYDCYPILSETNKAYSISFEKGGMVYHRHILKVSQESVEFLSDYWPYVEDYRVEYGNYAVPSNTSLINRKPVCAIAPQPASTFTVVSVTASTITFATNTVKRMAITGYAAGTAGNNANASRLTVASTTGLYVGQRIVIKELNKIDTLCYVIKIVSSTVIEIDGTPQDTYTYSGSNTMLSQDLEGRFIILNPSNSLDRYRIGAITNDTLTINTFGIDLTTKISTGSIVRLSEEVINLVDIIMSGDANMTISVDQYNPNYYGDQLLHELARVFVLSAGGTFTMRLPIKLTGNDGDYVLVRCCDTKNVQPNSYITITATVKA